jgi:hypothetical protein
LTFSAKEIMIVKKRRSDIETLGINDSFIHCKKRTSIFPSPAGIPLSKLSLAGKNLIIPGQRVFG